MKKILSNIVSFSLLIFLVNPISSYGGVNYYSADVLGYKIAQIIIKRKPKAENYVYNTECIMEAKNNLRMGMNLRLADVALSCMDYITNRNKLRPNTRDANYLIENVKN